MYKKLTILAKKSHEIMDTVVEKRSLFSCAQTERSGLQKVRCLNIWFSKMSDFKMPGFKRPC
jgi:hypothetical protein